MADWGDDDNYLYHSNLYFNPNELYLIDPISSSPKLIQFPAGVVGEESKWPICELSASAGIAVFQVFDSSRQESPFNGGTAIVIGDFTKFGADQGFKPDIPLPAQPSEGAYQDYLDAINRASAVTYDGIALRHTCALYVRVEVPEGETPAKPVTYTIGQQHIESIPDSNQAEGLVSKSIYLSSVATTPGSQLNMGEWSPTFSYSLYNFHKKDCDYATLDELKEAPALSSSMTGLSAFDLLLRHKDEHPNPTGAAANNAMARLEYISLSAITDLLGGTVDSKLSSLQLSSIAELTDIDPDTHEETKYHQLYGFDAAGMGTFALSDQNEFELVVREWHTTGGNGARVNYINLSAFVDAVTDGLSVKVDSRDGGLSSIGYDEADRLELYNFSQGQRVQKNDKFDIVVRDNQHGKVDYTPLSALGSGYPGPWEITINEQTGDATFTNCVAKVARAYHFFQDQSANVGGGDKMVYFVMTHATSPSVHMYVGNYSSAPGILGGTDANCISASITPLYRITDNKVTCDYRYMLNIQAYDNRNFSTTMYY